MAVPITTPGSKWLLKIGDGLETETFDAEHTCSFRTRNAAFETETSENHVPDCDDPDKPMARIVDVVGYGLTITGEGIAKATSIPFFAEWLMSGEGKNVRLEHAVTAAQGGGHYGCAIKLTSFSVGATKGERTTFSATLTSDGEVSWTPAPPPAG